MYKMWLSVFGAGYSPWAPGTCGSAVVTILFIGLALTGMPMWALALVMGIVAFHGGWVTVRYGDRMIAEYGEDPSQIVSDEQSGQAITYLWIWSFVGWKNAVILGVAGFLLFRVMDIIKPPPARQFDRIHGSWGVLLDDVAAGVYANILLQLVWRLGWLDRFL